MVSATDQHVSLAASPLHRQQAHLDDVILDLRDRLRSRPMQLVAVPHPSENLGMANREDRCCPYPPVFHSVAPQSTIPPLSPPSRGDPIKGMVKNRQSGVRGLSAWRSWKPRAKRSRERPRSRVDTRSTSI